MEFLESIKTGYRHFFDTLRVFCEFCEVVFHLGNCIFMIHLPENTKGCKLFGTKIGRGINQGEGGIRER